MEKEIDKFLEEIEDEEYDEPKKKEVVKIEGMKEKPIDLSFDEGLKRKFSGIKSKNK